MPIFHLISNSTFACEKSLSCCDEMNYVVLTDSSVSGLRVTYLQVSVRASDSKPSPDGALAAFAYVKYGDDPAAARANLSFQDLAYGRIDIRSSSAMDLAKQNCELPILPADGLLNRQHWSGQGLFGTSDAALRSLGLRNRIGGNGAQTNVVIVDHGVSFDYLSRIGHGDNFWGGWISIDESQPNPGEYSDIYTRQPDWHGNMIARNVLRVAPKCRIFDAPLLPKRIDNIEAYTGQAELLFESIQFMIRHCPIAEGPWVIVNAWAVADSASEHGSENYSNNPNHRLNELIREMVQEDNVAFVFAAGNNGQFGGDPRNGTYDVGPGRSILGANGLSCVLTVGAVRTDGLWIGSSSQGPGPDRLGHYGTYPNKKPDLCAPSWFGETDQPEVPNTGTSAACGLAAGMVALLLSENPEAAPVEIFDLLRLEALANSGQTGWSPRLGVGPIFAPPVSRGAVSKY